MGEGGYRRKYRDFENLTTKAQKRTKRTANQKKIITLSGAASRISMRGGIGVEGFEGPSGVWRLPGWVVAKTIVQAVVVTQFVADVFIVVAVAAFCCAATVSGSCCWVSPFCPAMLYLIYFFSIFYSPIRFVVMSSVVLRFAMRCVGLFYILFYFIFFGDSNKGNLWH